MTTRRAALPNPTGLAPSLTVRTVLASALLLVGGSVGWTLNNRSSPPASATSKQEEPTLEPPPSSTKAAPAEHPIKPRKVSRSLLIKPDTLYEPESAERERAYLESQSQELIDLLMHQLDVAAEAPLGGGTEELVNRTSEYQAGLIDGVIRTAPELADALSLRVEEKLCDESGKDAHKLAMARLLRRMPEASSEKAADCVLKRGKEDVVLWAVLDALRAADLPPPASVREHAWKDQRTLDRIGGDRARPAPSSEAPSNLGSADEDDVPPREDPVSSKTIAD